MSGFPPPPGYNNPNQYGQYGQYPGGDNRQPSQQGYPINYTGYETAGGSQALIYQNPTSQRARAMAGHHTLSSYMPGSTSSGSSAEQGKFKKWPTMTSTEQGKFKNMRKKLGTRDARSQKTITPDQAKALQEIHTFAETLISPLSPKYFHEMLADIGFHTTDRAIRRHLNKAAQKADKEKPKEKLFQLDQMSEKEVDVFNKMISALDQYKKRQSPMLPDVRWALVGLFCTARNKNPSRVISIPTYLK